MLLLPTRPETPSGRRSTSNRRGPQSFGFLDHHLPRPVPTYRTIGARGRTRTSNLFRQGHTAPLLTRDGSQVSASSPQPRSTRRRSETDTMTANWDLIDDVLKGTAQFRSLNHSERQYAHAAIDAAIARRARETKLGRDLLAAGQTMSFSTQTAPSRSAVPATPPRTLRSEGVFTRRSRTSHCRTMRCAPLQRTEASPVDQDETRPRHSSDGNSSTPHGSRMTAAWTAHSPAKKGVAGPGNATDPSCAPPLGRKGCVQLPNGVGIEAHTSHQRFTRTLPAGSRQPDRRPPAKRFTIRSPLPPATSG